MISLAPREQPLPGWKEQQVRNVAEEDMVHYSWINLATKQQTKLNFDAMVALLTTLASCAKA